MDTKKHEIAASREAFIERLNATISADDRLVDEMHEIIRQRRFDRELARIKADGDGK